MEQWNLFADASVTPAPVGGSKDVVPCGWAAIVQNVANETDEHVVCGSDMGPLQSDCAEIKAMVAGLEAVKRGEHVRVFLDNLHAFHVLYQTIVEVTGSADSFVESLQPLGFRQHVLKGLRINHHYSYDRQLPLYRDPSYHVALKHLRSVVEDSAIAFTKVSNMKNTHGKHAFPAHERCDQLAKEMRIKLCLQSGIENSTSVTAYKPGDK